RSRTARRSPGGPASRRPARPRRAPSCRQASTTARAGCPIVVAGDRAPRAASQWDPQAIHGRRAGRDLRPAARSYERAPGTGIPPMDEPDGVARMGEAGPSGLVGPGSGRCADPDMAVGELLGLPDRGPRLRLIDAVAGGLERGIAVGRGG